MTDHTTHGLALQGERGMALIATLLLLLVMSGLAVALTTSGRVEVAMGDNEELYAGARAAAESGLNRAAAQILALTNNPTYPLNNLLLGEDPGNTADNGLMSSPTSSWHLPDMGGASPCVADATLPCWPLVDGYSYTVRLYDDDDPLMSRDGTGFSPAELSAMGPPPDPPEDGTAVSDVNKRIVIRAQGYGPKGTFVRLEQMLNPIKMPALLVDGDLELSGNASIIGLQGSVHANENLEIPDFTVTVRENVTSTGTLTAHARFDPDNGIESGGMPEIPVPDITADAYIDEADFILHDDGSITNRAEDITYCMPVEDCSGIVPAGSTMSFGWYFSSGAWRLSQKDVVSATYFVETDAQVNGNTGSGSTTSLTIIARGDIVISGTPDLMPEPSSDLMFVTEKDLVITGNLVSGESFKAEGRILVREQIALSGNGYISGQVIVQDADDTPDSEIHCPTTDPCNVVTGSMVLEYNGSIETIAYTVSGWRETP